MLFTGSGAWGWGYGATQPYIIKEYYTSLRIFLPEYYKKDGSLVDLEELTTNQAYFTSVLLSQRTP